jgi:hypothetical protein
MTTTATAPAKRKPAKKVKAKVMTPEEVERLEEEYRKAGRLNYPELIANTFNEFEADMFDYVIGQIKWHLGELTLDGLADVEDPKERMRMNVTDLKAATALAHLLFESADVAR